ncbi:hypothetical protein SKAU_G00104760 [Synaphobranchus kaupii]|uniref:Uncharacterized protein n=1 Tax=Synaphobranchus kaupii TaxID=118154 RepID=A0A9Q1FZ23_SYNKA|nr:hypothetical protein SKAU_G00104760 [Synaphobranchus kaupii]
MGYLGLKGKFFKRALFSATFLLVPGREIWAGLAGLLKQLKRTEVATAFVSPSAGYLVVSRRRDAKKRPLAGFAEHAPLLNKAGGGGYRARARFARGNNKKSSVGLIHKNYEDSLKMLICQRIRPNGTARTSAAQTPAASGYREKTPERLERPSYPRHAPLNGRPAASCCTSPWRRQFRRECSLDPSAHFREIPYSECTLYRRPVLHGTAIQ